MKNHLPSSEQSFALRIATFFATIMVVLRHSQNLHLYYEGGNPFMPICDANVGLQRLATELTHIAIPGFFLISGFLFFRNVNSWQDCIDKWRGRARTLLLPYILWNTISIVFWLCVSLIPALKPQLKITFGLEYSLIWIIRKLTYAPLVGQFWYIRTLMIFILLTPLLYSYILKSKALSLIVLATLIQFWQAIDTRLLSTEGAMFFFLGSWMACHSGLPEKQPVKLWFWLLLPIIYGLLTNLDLLSLQRLPNALTIGLMLYVGWQVCLLVANAPYLQASIQSWHRHSFFLYALHGFVVSALSLLISRAAPHTPKISLSMYVLAFLVTLTICYGISFLTQRLLPKWHSILSGGR